MNDYILFVLLLIMIIVLTYIFDKYVNPFGEYYSRINDLISNRTQYIQSNRVFHHT